MEGEQEADRSLRRALQEPHRRRGAARSLPAVSHLPQRAARQRHRDQPAPGGERLPDRSEEHTSELQSLAYIVCRLLLEKKKPPRPLTPPVPESTRAGRAMVALARGPLR